MQIGYRDNVYGVWSWPEYDHHAFKAITIEASRIPQVLNLMRAVHPERLSHEVIQAGGNAGMFPCLLSSSTVKVWTFEADWVNYRALIANASDRDSNLVAIYGVLWWCAGQKFDMGWAIAELDNSGAQFAIEQRDGDVPSYAIDQSFPHINPSLIWLDIEGAEGMGIAGAVQTIAESEPVIVLEMKGLSARYGMQDSLIVEALEGMGYVHVASFARDVVFVPRRRARAARQVIQFW